MALFDYDKVVNNCKFGMRVIDLCKLHLFPLSMLTKPIIVKGYNDGKEFVPIEELFRLEYSADETIELRSSVGVYSSGKTIVHNCRPAGSDGDMCTTIIEGVVLHQPYWIVEQLIEWYFNVFDIDEDQFIDASKSKVYE